MQLIYLGTAAAEGIPGAFCSCAICQEARRLGGRNIRTRSQALIDDHWNSLFGKNTSLAGLSGGKNIDCRTL